jgi:DNA-binding NarL/FixJ family response regulator
VGVARFPYSDEMSKPAPDPVKISVLVADDHAEIRELLSLFLEMADAPKFNVVGSAADGQEAVDMARDRRPDAAILDLSMPRMDGLEAARLLRDEHPSMVIVIYSGFEAAEFAKRAEACGANAYVEKGSRGMDEVIAQLRRLLDAGKHDEADNSATP